MAKNNQLRCFVLFREPRQKQRAKVRRNMPVVLRRYELWEDELWCFGSPDQSYLKKHHIGTLVQQRYAGAEYERGERVPEVDEQRLPDYGADDDASHDAVRRVWFNQEYGNRGPWRSFYKELDTWLLELHAQHPIALFVRETSPADTSPLSQWQQWSLANLHRVMDAVAAYVTRPGRRSREARHLPSIFIGELCWHYARDAPNGVVATRLLELLRPFSSWVYADVVERLERRAT